MLGVDDVFERALPAVSYASVYSEATKATQTKYFSGSKNVSFTGLASGWYRITVPKPAQHICREDPDTPGRVESLNNPIYANPRRIWLGSGWVMAGFEFLSTVTVSSGVIRDAWTGGFIDGAALAFTATSGSLAGSVVDGDVMLASYSTDWASTSAGLLPADVVLGACNWNLAVSRGGYTTVVRTGAVKNQPVGSEIALGTIYLTPVDANSNGIQDGWESTYFPGGCDPEADADDDGLSNRAEYLCGTVPTSSASAMRILDVRRDSGGLSLTWSAAAGRSYRVVSSGTPDGTGSVVTNGPWEAAHGETAKTWADPDAASSASRFYRIHLALPF